LAESLENTRQKSEKAKSKTNAKKQETTAREENDARAQWESAAPLIFERLQNMDEARMIMLKDLFVKFIMIQVETSESAMSETEGIMNALLSLTPTKEVEEFVGLQKGTRITHERRRSIISNPQTNTPSPALPAIISRPTLTQTRSNTLSIPEDTGSIREKRKSRFGTILRSGRNSIRPNIHLGSSTSKKSKDSGQPAMISPPPMSGPTLSTPPTVVTAQNGVSERPKLDGSTRQSSVVYLDQPRSPIREDKPISQDEPSRGTEDAEQLSIMSSESNYAPPLRVEIMKEVIPEEAGEREVALQALQSTLRAQPTVSRRTRGRREGRNSTLVGEASEFGAILSSPIVSSPSSIVPPIQPMAQMSVAPSSPSLNRALSPRRYTDSDAQSLSSVRTASRPSGIALHPNLETPGFNISILETLSAILANGTVQKTFVMGEIALSNYGQRPSGIQLCNAENLEQVICNKAILNENGSGNYSLTTDSLPSKGVIALKYKVGELAGSQRLVPLLLRAMWKFEQGSMSLMVAYQLNPSFPGPAELSNVAIAATLSNEPPILNCQSKPVGQFSRERGQLLWQLSSVTTEEEFLLAKFSVDGLPTATGTIEAKWECRGTIISGIDVTGLSSRNPFAEDEEVLKTNVLKGLISGKYSCQA
jgi:F-BAR domain only protein